MCGAVSFHCDTLERVCRCHAVCKRMVKEETGNLYHSLLSTLRLEMKIIKSSGGIPRLSYTGRDDRHFVPTGLYIVRTVNGRKRESMLLFNFSLCLQVKSIDQARSCCNLVKKLVEVFQWLDMNCLHVMRVAWIWMRFRVFI